MMTVECKAMAGLTMAIITVALAGCMNAKTSGRDLVPIEARVASELMHGQARLFGLAGHGKTATVDPRVVSEYVAGHLPGAINVPFQSVSQRYGELHAYDVVVVYGADYDDPKAEAMSKRLLELGIKDVRTLRGGVRAWVAAGYTLDTGG